MFARDGKKMTLSVSPSYLPNNLSCSAANDNLVIVRGSDVHVIRTNGESTKVPMTKQKITQAKYVEVAHTSFLAVTSDQSFQLFTSDGNTQLFTFTINNLNALQSKTSSTQSHDSESTPTSTNKYFQGVDGSVDWIAVGVSTGETLIFDCATGEQTGQFPCIHILTHEDVNNNNKQQQEQHAIACLATSPSSLVIADVMGNLTIYNPLNAFVQTAFVRGVVGSVPTSIVLFFDSVIVVGYATGHIRLFRTDNTMFDTNNNNNSNNNNTMFCELAVEITAHSRAISALAIHRNSGLIASVSSDQFVHIWSMPSFNSPSNSTVNCVCSERIVDHWCTGVAFVGDNDKNSDVSRFAVASYDEEEIVFFTSA